MSKTNTREILDQFNSLASDFKSSASQSSIGYVISVADGIAKVRALKQAKYGECLNFSNNVRGIVMELNTSYISAVLLDTGNIEEGSEVTATGTALQLPASMDLLGRVIDPFGNIIDDGPPIEADQYIPLEREAPGILDRKSIDSACPTGVKVIDAFIPIGKGQREMIIGDRLTGKTSLALDMIINQKNTRALGEKVFCVYVAIGQQAAKIARVKAALEKHDAMSYTTIIACTSADPASWQVMAPFAGCALGEYFRDKGMHAIVIYDDLSKHAVAYRQLSLLLRNPPGREAYPGDIFYLHSRLLERAAQMNDEKGGGSLTAIPILETQEGNFATYIPTNVWSITDGQIVLKTDLFLEGQRPAIDIGLSVSRVGSAAQIPAMKSSISLKLILAQYQEYKNFARYGADIDQATQAMLETGNSLMYALKQKNFDVKSLVEQSVFFQACLKNKLNGLPEKQILAFEEKLSELLKTDYINITETINKTGQIDVNLDSEIEACLDHILDLITSQSTEN